jgi:hypothetical protein
LNVAGAAASPARSPGPAVPSPPGSRICGTAHGRTGRQRRSCPAGARARRQARRTGKTGISPSEACSRALALHAPGQPPAPTDGALAANSVPPRSLTVRSLRAVPVDVDGLFPPSLVMHSTLNSMTSLLSVIGYLNFVTAHATECRFGRGCLMPSGRLAARIGSGSARFLSCQLVGSLSMGGCRRRGGSACSLEDWHCHRGQLRRLAPPRRLRRTGTR